MQQKKLLAYSALATGMASVYNSADAQIQHTDIDPDIQLFEHLDELLVDIDANGSNNFQLLNFSSALTYYYPDPYNFAQMLWAGALGYASNAIAGYLVNFTYGSIIHSRIYALALEAGDTIDALHVNFHDGLFQRMAFRVYTNTNVYTGGQWIAASADKFLGLRLQTSDDSIHYGWLRCSVVDEGPLGFQLTAKDYAYEVKADKYIIAGDTSNFMIDTIIDDAIILEESLTKQIQITVTGNIINIYYQGNPGVINIELFNITGQLMLREQTTSEHTEIVLPYTAGIYFLQLSINGCRQTQKIVLH